MHRPLSVDVFIDFSAFRVEILQVEYEMQMG